MMHLTCLLLFHFGVLISILITCGAMDTITTDQVIRDGDTLVSADEMYELGFFSPGSSRNRYLGIWYYNILPQTVVWVANRETPVSDSPGEFKVLTNGSLLVISGINNTIVWSSNTSTVSSMTRNPVAQLLNTRNLVVREIDTEVNFIWQSFDYPGDTFLAGMKVGKDLVTGIDRRWRPWKSLNDPSAGEYEWFLNTNGFPQWFQERDSRPVSRFGPWNGLTFNGFPKLVRSDIVTHEFVFNESHVYYTYTLVNSPVRFHAYTNPVGHVVDLTWNNRTQSWGTYWDANPDVCSKSGLCGPNGRCTENQSPVCSCMEGFEPQNPNAWSASEWSSSCKRRTPLGSSNGDGFRVFKNVKLPDTRYSWYNKTMTLEQCARSCKNNRLCTAYANIDIRTGDGCLLWFGDLIDIQAIFASQDLHVRMALSDLTFPEYTRKAGSKKNRVQIIVVVSILSALIMMFLILAVAYVWSKKRRHVRKTLDQQIQPIDEENSMESQLDNDDIELSYFSVIEILKYTNNFSNQRKLGEGGFGAVYNGVLDDGREIAVKRLSKTSKQGISEFKNELKFIAKLQRRNLVKLLGYCSDRDENMLIYEYMTNRSLDLFIFDKSKSSKLHWSDRFHTIRGITRGLLYLHYDSRFKIIHRDLKASNILLDTEMTTKISDFGLARMFRDHENEANTNRVVGTLGYIAPEYAVVGKFSEKSDVFSFGVLVLEIISEKKNNGFSQESDCDNLLSHISSSTIKAWRLYKDGKALELLSAHMRESCVESEVLRSIHIGLLCVQHHVKDRPNMLTVILMFDQDGELPPPKQPAYFAKESVPNVSQISVNKVTMTTIEPREHAYMYYLIMVHLGI